MQNEIDLFFHCKKCHEENMPRTETMQSFSQIEAGWTKKGFQVWCVRHNCNIAHIDFMGQKIRLAEADDAERE